jgi:membrane fusion protein, multidrug efflux system
VISINPASGTAFSLLPPENATGNWVKVTQRVPVRVEILNPSPKYPLRVGTSAEVSIDTLKAPAAVEAHQSTP